MTDLEQRAAQLLPQIRYAPDMWHEPRAKFLYRVWKSDPLWNLTALEQADLWWLIWHYRRQVDDADLVWRADEVTNGVLALRF
jgi:hypothetical protein